MKRHRIGIFGCTGVGKSSLVIRYIYDYFVEKLDPTVEDDYDLIRKIDGEETLLSILDTVGIGQFSSCWTQNIKSCNGFVLVYSLTDTSTYNELTDIRKQILQIKDSTDVPVILVGNKCDLENARAVSKDEGANLAELFNECPFLESSAKEDINVTEVFENIVRLIRKNCSEEQEQEE